MLERDEKYVLPAIPEGSGPIQTAERWITDLINHPKFIWRRKDFRNNVLAVAPLLLERCDFASFTVTPGRDWLLAMSGLKDRTLTRVLRWLRDHGFLGVVGCGRTVRWIPASSHDHSRWPQGGRPVNDRAVYVLCQPMTDEELAERIQENIKQAENKCRLDGIFTRWGMAVDINVHPLRNSRKADPKNEWASPTLKSYFEAAARETARLEAARTDLSWPRHRTTSANDEAEAAFNRLQAARTVRLHTSTALSGLSDRHLTQILTPWFKADWSPADILEALDTRPDGKPWGNDAGYGVKNVAAWLQSRLSAHRVNGQIPYSPTQRRELRARPARERAIEFAKRMLKLR